MNLQTNKRRKRRSFRRQRRGLITWGSLLSVMFLMMLAAYVSNVAIVVNQKVRTQNAADATAYSATVWIARGMNSVSATNHVIGEINAIYVLHHALGGKWLDDYGAQRKRYGGDWTPFAWYGGLPYKTTKGLIVTESWVLWPAHKLNLASELVFPFVVPDSGPGPSQDHYDLVIQDPIADINSTIWEGKENLKRQMVIAYGIHIAGSVKYEAGWAKFWKGTIGSFFTFGASSALAAEGYAAMIDGARLKKSARSMEDEIYREYQFLDRVEDFAISIAGVKKILPRVASAIHHIYQLPSVRLEIPAKAHLAAAEVASRQGMLEGFALGDWPDSADITEVAKLFPSLPVEREAVTNEDKTQMVRATYPWVRYWRKNITLALLIAPRSLASSSYVKWTNYYTRDASAFLRNSKNTKCDTHLTVINRRSSSWKGSSGSRGMNGQDIRLYVLMDLGDDGSNKGDEKWVQATLDGSKRADELFCSTGFTRSTIPPVVTTGFFRQENPSGMACYSQAMIYNANTQIGPNEPFSWWDDLFSDEDQPHVGWDTLAWDHDRRRVPEWEETPWPWQRVSDLAGAFYEKPPLIKLNWQSKLTPVTVHKMTKTLPVAAAQSEEMRTILGDALLEQLPLQNH